MSLRDLVRKHLGAVMSQTQRPTGNPKPSAPENHQLLLEVSQADEMGYLREQITQHLSLVKTFDAELRQNIARLHEPPPDSPIERSQVDLIKSLKSRCGIMLSMAGYEDGHRHPAKTHYQLQDAIKAMELESAKGEADNLLKGIKELYDVLASTPLENVTTNPVRADGYRKCLAKLILTNLYGKDALLDLYPENRRTFEQIKQDFKNSLA